MIDNRTAKMAKILVNYSLSIKEGDVFYIHGNEPTTPLMREVFKQALLKGAFPEIKIYDEELREILIKYGTDEQLSYVSPNSINNINSIDAVLRILGTNHTKALQNYDSRKIALSETQGRTVSKILQQRAYEGNLRWSLAQFPTNAAAMDADMSLSEFEDFLYSACFVDKDDPIKEWLKLKDEQQKIIDYISTKNHVRIVCEDTDLSLKIGGRTWINSCGTTNFPSGEVYTGPIEDSLNGKIRFSYPAIRSGKVVEDVCLSFENGKVSKASAKTGEDLLNQMINLDSGSCYAGEFALGTNYGIQKFTKNILFDEKIGGTIHIALGSAYPSTGSKNTSSLHWDMICDMRNGGEIYADGELFYKNGKTII